MAMKLISNQVLKNNIYTVNLSVIDITEDDREKFNDFGEPVIDIGGVVKGTDIKKEYVPVQEPVTETKTEKETVVEKQPVFEEDGVTPVYEEDGITQKTQDVEVEKDVEVTVPVLDANGKPVMKDKVDSEGKVIYELVETPIEVVLANLGTILRKFPSEFPIAQSFAYADYGDKTELIAETYVQDIKVKLDTAIAEYGVKTDTFTKTEIFPLG